MIRAANLIDALNRAPAGQPFITFWIDEDERQALTFGEFRRRAREQARVFRDHGLQAGDRVVVIMPQGIPAMTTFVAAMMLGAAPAFLAYPNFKVEPSKYRSGLLGVTANLSAKAVVIDDEFPEEMLACVSVGDDTMLLRAGAKDFKAQRELQESHEHPSKEEIPKIRPDGLAFIQHSAGTTGLQKESLSRTPPCCGRLNILPEL